MKVKILTWDLLLKEDPKQTAIQVHYLNSNIDKVRILIGDFSSREEAWNYCKAEGYKPGEYDSKFGKVQITMKLYQLSKIIKVLDKEKPKNVSALKFLL